MEQVAAWKSHGGTQGVYSHSSAETGTPMTFSVFVPNQAPGSSSHHGKVSPLPIVTA